MFDENFAHWTYNDPYDKKAKGWILHCANPVDKWSWEFDDWKDFVGNFEERARWGECSGVTVIFEDGDTKKYPMKAWSK